MPSASSLTSDTFLIYILTSLPVFQSTACSLKHPFRSSFFLPVEFILILSPSTTRSSKCFTTNIRYEFIICALCVFYVILILCFICLITFGGERSMEFSYVPSSVSFLTLVFKYSLGCSLLKHAVCNFHYPVTSCRLYSNFALSALFSNILSLCSFIRTRELILHSVSQSEI